MRRAPKPWPRPRSRCTTWSSKAAPPTRRSKPSHERIDRAAVRAIALGTLRWYLRLKPALAPLVNRPFDELSPQLARLLVTAAHQVEYSRGAAEAQVHLAVDASRVLGEGRASGVVNAVLRRFVAQRVELLAAADADLAQRHAHPRWLVDALVDGLGRSRRGDPRRPTTSIRPWCCGSTPAQMHAEDFLRSLARDGPRSARGRLESRGRGAGAARRRAGAARLRSRRGVGTGCAARSSPRRCSMRSPACACSTPARRPAERRCTSRSARRRSPSWSPSTTTPLRLARVRENLERAGRDAVLLSADLRTRAAVPRAGLLRSRAGRRALFGDRRDPPPSRTSSCCAGRATSNRFAATQRQDSRHGFRTTEARRTSDLLHLLGDAGGERRRGGGFPGRRTARGARGLARKPRAAAGIARSAGRLAVAARRRRGHRWLLLCLSH